MTLARFSEHCKNGRHFASAPTLRLAILARSYVRTSTAMQKSGKNKTPSLWIQAYHFFFFTVWLNFFLLALLDLKRPKINIRLAAAWKSQNVCHVLSSAGTNPIFGSSSVRPCFRPNYAREVWTLFIGMFDFWTMNLSLGGSKFDQCKFSLSELR